MSRGQATVSVARGREDFPMRKFADLLYRACGISTDEKKKHLMQTKVDRLLNRKGIATYDEYWELINRPGNTHDFQEFLDMMTTNTTEFFRENDHFDYIVNHWDYIMQSNPRIQKNREVVVWSSACSSGQEPVTIAMVLLDLLATSKYGVRILATDIDTQILSKAATGIYADKEIEGISPKLLSRFFHRVGTDYQVNSQVLQTISYRQFNLMSDFRFRNGFDFIFCRNVMIYFDNQTQETLINKFYDQLVPGGLFFMGHSESMVNKAHKYRPVAPALWQK